MHGPRSCRPTASTCIAEHSTFRLGLSASTDRPFLCAHLCAQQPNASPFMNGGCCGSRSRLDQDRIFNQCGVLIAKPNVDITAQHAPEGHPLPTNHGLLGLNGEIMGLRSG